MFAKSENRDLRRWVAWLKFVFKAGRIGRFLGYAGLRFLKDGGPRQAAGLSYASLLAIVPLLAVGLSVMAGFPVFESLRLKLQIFVFENVLPDAGIALSDHLITFIENAKKMTAAGMAGLTVTVLLLMSNINGAVNAIWRVAEPRPLAARLIVYCSILTLGPLFIGASLSVSSYAFAAVQWFDTAALGGVLGLSKFVSTGFSILGFALVYLVVPNRAIHPGHALTGGVVAAILFELLKAGFGLYLREFPSFQLVYGAVSALPIFLVWMYLSWAVILFGAEVAAALPEWRAAQARGRETCDPGARLALALSLLARLRDAGRRGRRVKERQLGRGLPATPAELDNTLRALRKADFVECGLGNRWALRRDLDEACLGDLIVALDLGLSPGQGWHPAAESAVADLADAAEGRYGRSIAEVLAPVETPAGQGGAAMAEPRKPA